MTTALKIRGESVRSMERAAVVRVAQAVLSPVGALDPSKHVIERPVLHHQHDDVFDAGRVRSGENRLREDAVERGTSDAESTAQYGGVL